MPFLTYFWTKVPKSRWIWLEDTYSLNQLVVLNWKILVSPFDQFKKHNFGLADMWNVNKKFSLPIVICQISGKNFELECWYPNLSKYLWNSGLILDFSSFHQRFFIYCGETMIFIQIFPKYWFENLKESCKMILFSL